MIRRIALMGLVLVGFALAGTVTYDMLLHRGATLNASTIALPAAAACTTNWQFCENARFQTLYWQLWVNKGATDSARVKIDVQWAVKDTVKCVNATDTLISVAVCNVLDTTAAKPHCFVRQYYPPGIVRWERYIITELSGNSDSSHVGKLVAEFDDFR